MGKFLALIAAIGVAAGGTAAPQLRPGFAFYSDICHHRETGDLIGTRIGVMNLSDGVYVFFQEAEGELDDPQTVKLHSGALTDSELSFQVTEPPGSRTFVGTLSETAIKGRFTDGGVGPTGTGVYNLKRVRLPEKSFPECR